MGVCYVLYYLCKKSGKISTKKGVGLYYVMGVYYVFYGTHGIPPVPKHVYMVWGQSSDFIILTVLLYIPALYLSPLTLSPSVLLNAFPHLPPEKKTYHPKKNIVASNYKKIWF